MITRACERTRFDVTDAVRLADPLPPLEFGRLGVADDRQMVRRGPQVLTDRDDVDAEISDIGQQSIDLVVGFAEADHEAGLRGEPRRLRPGEHTQRTGVAGRRPNSTLQAGNGFDVVVQHIRADREQ